MNRYTIYCTEEQTKKALELGAPINKRYTRFTDFIECILDKPTAEEMIGWLEEQGLYVDVTFNYCCGEECYYYTLNYNKVISTELFMPRKDATLAAIDAALTYLSNNKK